MSRTHRKLNPKQVRKDKPNKVRDGYSQHLVGSCNNNGGCAWCEGNRLHKHNKAKLKGTSYS